MADDGIRIEALQAQIETLVQRIGDLERRVGEAPSRPARPRAAPAVPAEPPPERAIPSSPDAGPRRPRPPSPHPAPRQAREAPIEARPPRERPKVPAPAPPSSISLEDLLGQRVLAWAGGVAVILGVAFFVAVAIGRGWIDEPTRIVLAASGSTALLAVGVYLGERHGRTQASLAAVGTAVAALFLTLTAATQLYDLVAVPVALVLAFTVGAVATTVAVRSNSRAVAGLGVVGALLAPVLVEAGTAGVAVAFMAVALLSATGILVWRRWDWLALTAFAVSTPQLLGWAADAPSVPLLLGVLFLFGAINLAAALGFELRVPAARLRPSSAMLVLASAMVVSGAGYGALRELFGLPSEGDAWIAMLGVVHLALGVAAVRSRRVSRPLGLLLITAGVLLGDVAFGLAASGPVLAGGWAAGSVALAVVARRSRPDAGLAHLGLGTQLLLSITHVLLFDAPLDRLPDGFPDLPGTLAALASLSLAAVLSARFVREENAPLRRTLDTVAMVALAYLAAAALDGPLLVLAFAVQAYALVEVFQRTDDEVACVGGLCFLALAGLHAATFEAPISATFAAAPSELPAAVGALAAVAGAAFACARSVARKRAALTGALDVLAIASVAYAIAVVLDGPQLVVGWAACTALLAALALRGEELAPPAAIAGLLLCAAHALGLEAPPTALVLGASDPLGACAALAAVSAAALLAGSLLGGRRGWSAEPFEAVGALFLVYTGSVAIVSGFQPYGAAAGADLLNLDVRQQGQVLVSAFWSVTGLAALVAGLVRDERRLRLGGLALLVAAFAKVFLYDLSTLDSIYRVLSFVALGLLLLAGAFAYQRLRPATPRVDLREADAYP